jgi:hypothetical protein
VVAGWLAGLPADALDEATMELQTVKSDACRLVSKWLKINIYQFYFETTTLRPPGKAFYFVWLSGCLSGGFWRLRAIRILLCLLGCVRLKTVYVFLLFAMGI